MALTAAEEALVRQLLDEQAALLSLASSEATIISKLGATKVTLADLTAVSALADADLMLARQSTTDKSLTASVLAQYVSAKIGSVRIRLTGNLTLYVATTGSDSNNGLSAGSPFLTIQKAWNTLRDNYDLNGYSATIQLADGTYTAGLNAYGFITGQKTEGDVVVNGNSGTPSDVLINVAGGGAINGVAARFSVRYLKVQGDSGISADNLSHIAGSFIDFGACTSWQAYAAEGSYLSLFSYTISGGAQFHLRVGNKSISVSTGAITLTGTPAFSNAFSYCEACSYISHGGSTFTGTATGIRYKVSENAVIDTNGGGANFLPGDSAGTTATGGQYV